MKNIDVIFKHFKTILNHKYWVGKYCFLAGLYWRGIKHDISKFHPIEFIESIKYYTGTRSPIDVCKEKNGISYAWIHHKGHNDHHYLYWQDDFDDNTVPKHIHMPYKALLESICDSLGAARTYYGEEFSYYKEYQWYCWLVTHSAMNDTDKRIVLFIIFKLAYIELEYGYVYTYKIKNTFRKTFKKAYNEGLQIHKSNSWQKRKYKLYAKYIKNNIPLADKQFIYVDIDYYNSILNKLKRGYV